MFGPLMTGLHPNGLSRGDTRRSMQQSLMHARMAQRPRRHCHVCHVYIQPAIQDSRCLALRTRLAGMRFRRTPNEGPAKTDTSPPQFDSGDPRKWQGKQRSRGCRFVLELANKMVSLSLCVQRSRCRCSISTTTSGLAVSNTVPQLLPKGLDFRSPFFVRR